MLTENIWKAKRHIFEAEEYNKKARHSKTKKSLILAVLAIQEALKVFKPLEGKSGKIISKA